MIEDHYTVKLRDGKYTITRRHGQTLELLRHNEPWPGADDLRYCNVLIAAVERIQDLEEAIKAVLEGSLDPAGHRRLDGMNSYAGNQMTSAWRHDLTKTLNQEN